MNQEEDLLERYNEIIDEALEKSNELIASKPRIAEVLLKQLLKVDSENLFGLQLLSTNHFLILGNASRTLSISCRVKFPLPKGLLL